MGKNLKKETLLDHHHHAHNTDSGLGAAFLLNFGFTILELIGGIWTNSVAITADALHCQQKSSRFVTQELGADYLWGLKGNQDGILERAQVRLPQRFFPP